MGKLGKVIMFRKIAELSGCPIYLRCAIRMIDALDGKSYDITSYLEKQEENKMEKFWICWVEGTDGGRHYRHWSLQRAQTEAERLARLPNIAGREVYIFECRGKCKVEQSPVKWEVVW